MPLRQFALITAMLALAQRDTSAQPPAQSGLARDARLGTPLACLHVALLDSAERAVAHTVTDSAGTFVLVAPAAGVYRVGFEILGWERLLGPVDTLRDGEMRERVYPLTFGETPDDTHPIADLRRAEGAEWHSAVVSTPDADIRYPTSMRQSGAGSVVAQYVVDARGRVRSDSWRPIASTHPEYLAALRAHAPAMRYEPARLDGRPVCQLVRNHVQFDRVGPLPRVTLSN